MKLKFNKKKFSFFLASALIFGICKNNKALAMDFEIINNVTSKKTEKTNIDDFEVLDFDNDVKSKKTEKADIYDFEILDNYVKSEKTEKKEDGLIDKMVEILENFDEKNIKNEISTEGKKGNANLKVKGKNGLPKNRMQRLIRILKEYKKNFQDIEKTTKLEDKIYYSDHDHDKNVFKGASIDIDKKNVEIDMSQGSVKETRSFELLDDNRIQVTIITNDSHAKCTEKYTFTKKQ